MGGITWLDRASWRPVVQRIDSSALRHSGVFRSSTIARLSASNPACGPCMIPVRITSINFAFAGVDKLASGPTRASQIFRMSQRALNSGRSVSSIKSVLFDRWTSDVKLISAKADRSRRGMSLGLRWLEQLRLCDQINSASCRPNQSRQTNGSAPCRESNQAVFPAGQGGLPRL